MLLPSLISLRHPPSHIPTPEDIFGSTLGSIFTDDLQNQHGDDPDTTIVYKSRVYGEIELRTADVNGEEQRRKFAHYLWNAGVLMGEVVGGRPEKEDDKGERGVEGGKEGGDKEVEGDEDDGWKNGEWWLSKEEESDWSVRGEKVLELGAGVGLGGIVSALAGAEEVTITDYPAPPILSAITSNVSKNIPAPLRPRVTIQPHLWGSTSTSFETQNAQRYTRILAADCLWMPWEHANLAKSMLHFLADAPDARVYCIAGFHTGRAKVAPFFEEVVPAQGLAVEQIFEMNADGERRAWAVERDGGREDVGERKKWLVVARLKRAEPQ